MFIFTREFLREQHACYTDERIAALIPDTGLDALGVLALDIPAADRVWCLTRRGVLTPDQRAVFAKGCACRARGYAAARAYAAYAAHATYAGNPDRAARAAAHAAAEAAAAAYAYVAAEAAYAYVAAEAAERESQVAHLRELLGSENAREKATNGDD